MSRIECRVTNKPCLWNPEGNCGNCFASQNTILRSFQNYLKHYYPDLDWRRLDNMLTLIETQAMIQVGKKQVFEVFRGNICQIE